MLKHLCRELKSICERRLTKCENNHRVQWRVVVDIKIIQIDFASVQIPPIAKMSSEEAARASLQAEELSTNKNRGFQPEIGLRSHWSRDSGGIWACFNVLMGLATLTCKCYGVLDWTMYHSQNNHGSVVALLWFALEFFLRYYLGIFPKWRIWPNFEFWFVLQSCVLEGWSLQVFSFVFDNGLYFQVFLSFAKKQKGEASWVWRLQLGKLARSSKRAPMYLIKSKN